MEQEALLQRYEAKLETKGHSPHTIQNYLSSARQFLNHITENETVTEEQLAAPENIELFIHDKKDSGCANKTVNRHLNGVKKFLQAVDVENPFFDEEWSLRTEDKLPVWLEEDEVNALIEAAPTLRDKAIITVLYTTGMRISELLALNREDFGEEIRVTGKGSKERFVYPSDQAQRLVNTYLEQREDTNEALFVNHRNANRISAEAVNDMLHDAADDAGIDKPVTAHKLRHSFGTKVYKEYGVRFAQKSLGHEDISTTQVYTHIADEESKEKLDKLFD